MCFCCEVALHVVCYQQGKEFCCLRIVAPSPPCSEPVTTSARLSPSPSLKNSRLGVTGECEAPGEAKRSPQVGTSEARRQPGKIRQHRQRGMVHVRPQYLVCRADAHSNVDETTTYMRVARHHQVLRLAYSHLVDCQALWFSILTNHGN